MRKQTVRERLLASTMICGVAMAAFAAAPAYAQEEAAEVEEIVVTGSRIARQDYVANSPITTVTGEAAVANADITLDTYLNNLPQVNPAGTTTSNNPGNGGQSNIDLRGFGANRNIVLVDGRRAMPSANNLTVDINTIPQALVDRIEVITGGAGATYGADAIAGAVNVILKNNFEGMDVRGSYSNSTEEWDAEEYQFQAVLGGNFADGKGNAVIAFDRSYREPLIKSQRDFAKFATSTTSFLPEGALFWSGSNPVPLSAIQGVFAGYGVAPGDVAANSGRIGFNLDGTLFYAGIFNSPLDVQNFKYAIDDSVNQSIFPDTYSYNFDAVNLLVLPMDRYSFMGKTRYEFDNGVEVFAQIGWTEYNSTTALAPTPIPTVRGQGPGGTNPTRYTSNLINPGMAVGQVLIVPVTNPFISPDLATLLAARTGDDPNLAGSGATEAFQMRQRTLDIGLRKSVYENTVVQFLAGARGNLFSSDWKWEAYVSEGRTEIDQTQTGNVDTQRLQNLLEAADGGDSICAGGFNPFGRQPISAECVDYLEVSTMMSTEMTQQVAQGFVTGEVVELPAGPMEVVLGAEYRGFEYSFDPGAASGPISGFNTQTADAGTNSFRDIFAEALIPLVKDQPFAQSIDLNIGWRSSTSEFKDKINDVTSDERTSHAYKADLNWEMNDYLRGRLSYQRSVRAPNFGELFAGGGSAPQYFDPCSVTSEFRDPSHPDAAARTALCANAGILGGVGSPGTFVQNPGGQMGVDLSGNTDLRPEEGTTITAGLTFSSPWDSPLLSNLRGSIDYWNIKVDNAILVPTPNQIVAACYNYYGTNPTYDPNNQNCQAILRLGGDILWLYDPSTPDGVYSGANGGHQKASGIDVQVDWGFDTDDIGLAGLGSVRTNLLLTHLLEWKQQDPIVGVPEIDFAGTASYFGAGLGTSFPKWKAVWNTNWQINDMFDVSARMRYIGEMDNRLDMEFPGESEFTGPDAVVYWDFSGGWAVTDNAEFRLGVNNAFNVEAEQYAPNVQSGTDPSTYDVVGRRVFAQFRLRY